jgi:hypothetical protein
MPACSRRRLIYGGRRELSDAVPRRVWSLTAPQTSRFVRTKSSRAREVQAHGELDASWQADRQSACRCSGDYEQIMNRASCLSLLSNAVLVWSTMAIMKIITQLRAAGETVADEDLARTSPLMYQHVIPNGTYHFARSKRGDDIA